MATTFKTLTSNDVTTTRTLLHEAIPITGSIVSGTYTSEGNIKSFSHGMFESVFDYPHLSSSANHIFDVTMGYSSNSQLSSSTSTQNSKKLNLYNQMAQVLVGHDTVGNILEFDQDGNLSEGTKHTSVFFLNFSRLLSKDEIKKGSFELELGVSGGAGGSYSKFQQNGKTFSGRIKITDASGSNGYFTNSPAGEYGVLFATASATSELGRSVTAANQSYAVGLIYYQAGIAVLSGSVFNRAGDGGILNNLNESVELGANFGPTGFNAASGSTIDAVSTAIRNRIYNLSFNNTTELNSTIYFCRANHNDFNYSSNPTYLTNSKIRVKTSTADSPVSYITTVGLYSADNELLAVAKLSEPLKKTPESELTLRVRLDY